MSRFSLHFVGQRLHEIKHSGLIREVVRILMAFGENDVLLILHSKADREEGIGSVCCVCNNENFDLLTI